MKRALITGINGQDGSYLTELLIEKGYEVHGIVRRTSIINRDRLEILRSHERVNLYYGDMIDSSNLNRILARIQPHEIYNLAAQSHVAVSFELPEYTTNVNALGTLRILDAVRDLKLDARFYQASTSELYGKVSESPQHEKTIFHPRSPYAVAKLFSYWIVIHYREAFQLHASNGILFNHESPRRGENFVTRKITIGIAKILSGKMDVLYLGNLDTKRDWGYAPDYVQMMWLMLQQDTPDDFVVATGEQHSVREFVEMAFDYAGMPLRWEGEGLDEKGIDKKTGKVRISVLSRYFRPTEVDTLLGDASKAQKTLGWKPTVNFPTLVRIMVDADCEAYGIHR